MAFCRKTFGIDRGLNFSYDVECSRFRVNKVFKLNYSLLILWELFFN
jgi:hypothetical protein